MCYCARVWLPKKPPGQETPAGEVTLTQDLPQDKRTCINCFRTKLVTAFSVTGRGVDRHGRRHRRTTCDVCLERRRGKRARSRLRSPDTRRAARRRVEYARRVRAGLCGKCASYRGRDGTATKCRSCADRNRTASAKRRKNGGAR